MATEQMSAILPGRAVAMRMGWRFQVQWMDDGKPCFIRCRTGGEADRHVGNLRRSGESPFIIDLIDALQLH